MDRIKARYPLNQHDKKIINRYEKQTPGELAHIDLSRLPKDLKVAFKLRDVYVAAVCDDCTRLVYAEILKAKKAANPSKKPELQGKSGSVDKEKGSTDTSGQSFYNK